MYSRCAYYATKELSYKNKNKNSQSLFSIKKNVDEKGNMSEASDDSGASFPTREAQE